MLLRRQRPCHAPRCLRRRRAPFWIALGSSAAPSCSNSAALRLVAQSHLVHALVRARFPEYAKYVQRSLAGAPSVPCGRSTLCALACILPVLVSIVEVSSTPGWESGAAALEAVRNSGSDCGQTLRAAPGAAAAREAAGWAQFGIGLTSSLREDWDRGYAHSQKATKRLRQAEADPADLAQPPSYELGWGSTSASPQALEAQEAQLATRR